MLLHTTRPEEARDRRTTRRVGCRLRVMNDPLGAVVDISEGGVRLSLHHAVALHEDFDLPIKISDRIVWTRVHPVWAQPSSTPQLFDVGASFSILNEEDREAIRAYVGNRLRRPFSFLSRFLWKTESPI